MSSLQPIKSLNLDSVQQQTFVKYFHSLPEKPPTTVRIYDRNEYYTVYGIDATTAAREVFSSVSNIKQMGIAPNRLDYLILSKGNFETLVKKLLLVRRYRVEIYVAEGSIKGCEWHLKYKGSPGYFTQLEEFLSDGLGDSGESTPCLMAVNIKTDAKIKGRVLGVACVTAGDYQMSVTEFTDEELLTELEAITVQMAPTECLIPLTNNDDYKAVMKVMSRTNITVTKLKKNDFSTDGIIQDLNRLLKFKNNQQQDANVFPETRKTFAMTSLASVIKYISLLADNTNFGRFKLSLIETDCFLHLDAAALSALNVLPAPGDSAHSPSRSLLGLLDKCRTQQGKRLLAQWLRQPLRDINLIKERLDIVELLVNHSQLRLQLHEDHLRRIPDLQGLARRLTRKKANLHDCYKIYQAINRLPALMQCLSDVDDPTMHAALTEPISELNDDLSKYQEMIETTIDMDAVTKGEYLVKSSFDEELQRLSKRMDSLQASAEEEHRKVARDLGLDQKKNVRMDSNTQIGFHFRVTLKEERTLRDDKRYRLIDTSKGGVRFTSHNLERVNKDYIDIRTLYEKEQDKIVTDIVNIAAGYSECLFCLSHILSRLDVLVSFAMSAAIAPYPYCRPHITEDIDELVLRDVRHPCLELQEGVSYIPNDVVFKRGSCLMHIVTGANMGGKSTWMRSCGAAVVLCHVGSLVPATEARIPRLRALSARIGASDSEEHGHSTFMREMIETAAILKTATPDSLVLVDELGRGTSTYEGCGIAWAIAEELATKCKCFCMFATHYHELTRLASVHPGVIVNSHAEASVVNQQLVFLHKILPGPAANSLGIHVAKLADLPESIIEHAETRQAQLETNLFEIETDEKSQETAEGHKLIVDFLKKCKNLQELQLSEDLIMKEIDKLRQEILQNENKYVKSLVV